MKKVFLVALLAGFFGAGVFPYAAQGAIETYRLIQGGPALGTGVAAFLATPTSANLAAALTNETGGTGVAVFGTSPTITTDLTMTPSTSAAIKWSGQTQIDQPVNGFMRVVSTSLGFMNALAFRMPNKLLANGATALDGGAATDVHSLIDNTGVTARADVTLPTANAGTCESFIVMDTDGLKIIAPASTTIRDNATVSGSAGYICSTTVGSTLHLCSYSSQNQYAIMYKSGTWNAVDTACP